MAGVTDPHKESTWPGSWIAEDCWPSSNVHLVQFLLQPTGQLERIDKVKKASAEASKKSPESPDLKFCPAKTSLLCGQAGDLPITYSTADVAVDQRLDDMLSVCFQSAPLENKLEILGFPELTLDLRADYPSGNLVARLCDVFPDGRSTLICKGGAK